MLQAFVLTIYAHNFWLSLITWQCQCSLNALLVACLQRHLMWHCKTIFCGIVRLPIAALQDYLLWHCKTIFCGTARSIGVIFSILQRIKRRPQGVQELFQKVSGVKRADFCFKCFSQSIEIQALLEINGQISCFALQLQLNYSHNLFLAFLRLWWSQKLLPC